MIHVQGVLRGMGIEAGCQLSVWKESSSTGRIYQRCTINGEPEDLPNGPYTLSFGRHHVETRKWEGHWLLRYLPQGMQLTQAA